MSVTTCDVCGTRDAPRAHIERCERRRVLLDQLTARGRDLSIPAVTVADLYAHCGSRTNLLSAARVVQIVMDLGWRPVVGSDVRRLWTKP